MTRCVLVGALWASAEAWQGVPLRRAGDLGSAGRGSRAGHRPVRHRPCHGLGRHPPRLTTRSAWNDHTSELPIMRKHVDQPPGRPPAPRWRPALVLALVIGHRLEQRGSRHALAGVGPGTPARTCADRPVHQPNTRRWCTTWIENPAAWRITASGVRSAFARRRPGGRRSPPFRSRRCRGARGRAAGGPRGRR